MIVVDVNVLAYLHIQGDQTPHAENALRRDPEWTAPLLWRSEFRNVLILYVRRRIIQISDARRLMHRALSLMQGREYDVDSDQIFDILAHTPLSAYDAEYAGLAAELDVPLVTCDRRIRAALPDRAISLEAFALPR